MGWRTYEIGLSAGVANAYPHLHTLVFPRTTADGPDPSVELVSADPVDRVHVLKNEPGAGPCLVGRGTLAGVLYDEIDELVLEIAPIIIGAASPSSVTSCTSFRLASWEPTDAATSPSGDSFLSFRRPAGPRR